MKFSANTNEILNMSVLYPSQKKEFDLFGNPESVTTIFAMKRSTLGQFWFNVPVKCWTRTSHFEEDPDKGANNQFSNSVLPKDLVNDDILDEYMEDDFYNFISTPLEDAKLVMSFKTIDVNHLRMEEFERDYPNHIKNLNAIPVVKKYVANDWKKITYENGVYLGQVDAEGARTGKGCYIFESGTYMTGIYVKNVKDGQFREYNEKHSEHFDGIYVKGKKNGKGKSTFDNGSYYKGEFKNDLRQGQGEYWFPSGQRYVGNWTENKKEGSGCYFYNDNEWWDGKFRDNKWNGTGTYHFASGETEQITYDNGERVPNDE